MKQELDFYTFYHQFYLADKNYTGNTDGNFWNNDANIERMAIDKDIIGIATAAYGPIKGSIEIFNVEQELQEPDLFDHIVDGSLIVHSGTLQIIDCPNVDMIYEFEVPNGYYNVRLYQSNLDIEDEEEGGDYHKIHVWPISQPKLRTVIKQFSA